MKIEKINDNQIRCTLNRQDLQSRELKISELAYGTQKAKDLFRDMMEQADREFGFSAEDMPLMIEAIPVSMDCIVLVITKVEDPEELDTRFSRFAPNEDDEVGNTAPSGFGSDEYYGSTDDDTIDGLDGYLETKKNTSQPADSNQEANASSDSTITGHIEVSAESFVPFADALKDFFEKFAPKAGTAISDVLKEADVVREDTPDEDTLEEDASEENTSEENTPEENTSEMNVEVADALASIREAVDEIMTKDGTGELTDEAPTDEAAAPDAKEPELITRIFAFHSFDEASHAALSLNASFDGESALYKDESQGLYYLSITGIDDETKRFYAVSNELTEYSSRVKFTYSTSAYLAEHCRVIIKHDALDILKNY